MLNKETLNWVKPLDDYMDAYLKTLPNEHLASAMAYSLDAGGKRLRPLLLLSTAATFGQEVKPLLPAAAAVEFLHTYSLIHDDLPAMDNDDLRRGKPTSHKQFGEALAILAGDGLQTDAFYLLSQTHCAPAILVQLFSIFSKAAGANGMVAGQVLDMDGEHQQLDLAGLKNLHAHKTGALITAAVQMGAKAASVSDADFAALTQFARAFGLAFQIQDDINDVTKTRAQLGKTPGKDTDEHKNTYPGLLGLTGARQKLAEAIASAKAGLDQLSQPAPLLQAFLTYFD